MSKNIWNPPKYFVHLDMPPRKFLAVTATFIFPPSMADNSEEFPLVPSHEFSFKAVNTTLVFQHSFSFTIFMFILN